MNGIRTAPLINGTAYGWSQLTVSIGGIPITGITKINYSDKQAIEPVYGAGQYPVARGYGNITSTCSITLLRSEIEAIRASSPNGRLQDITPFDIVVSFTPGSGEKIITHKIRNCQFTNDDMEVSQGDVKNEATLELIVTHIEWGGSKRPAKQAS